MGVVHPRGCLSQDYTVDVKGEKRINMVICRISTSDLSNLK
jgi:hypothetical protein